MPSQKQIDYAIRLLGESGYGTRFMRAEHKALGAKMRDRSGSVESWLRKMNSAEISDLIDTLKSMQPEPKYRAGDDTEVQQLKKAAGPDAEIQELRKIAGLE